MFSFGKVFKSGAKAWKIKTISRMKYLQVCLRYEGQFLLFILNPFKFNNHIYNYGNNSSSKNQLVQANNKSSVYQCKMIQNIAIKGTENIVLYFKKQFKILRIIKSNQRYSESLRR